MGLRGHDRHRQDRRGRHHPRRQQSARHRAARRHGRAADGRAQHLRPSQPPSGPHACLRPRRPHHDAAGRRQVPLGHPQLRRHGAFHLPAGRGGPRRRRGHGQGRPVREVPLRADLRHAQQAQARCRQVRHPLGPADGGRRPVRHQDHRQGRARRAARDRHRSGDHRHPDHLGPAERGVAQRGAARFGGDLGHPDACRRRLQRHPAGGRAARHHPRLPQGDHGAGQGAHRDDLQGHRPDPGRQGRARRAHRLPAAGQRPRTR